MLNWWRARNERWAQVNWTLDKKHRVERRWQRKSRFGMPFFILVAGCGIALTFDLSLFTFSYLLGSVTHLLHTTDAAFVRQVYLWGPLKIWLPGGLFFAAMYYLLIREIARWPTCDSEQNSQSL